MNVAWLFNTLNIKKNCIQVGSLFNTSRQWQQQTYPSWNGLGWWDFNREKSKHLSQQRVLRMSRKAGNRKSEEKGTGQEFFILTSQPPSFTLPAVQLWESVMGESQGLWKNAWLRQALNQLVKFYCFTWPAGLPKKAWQHRLPCNRRWKRKLLWVCISPWKRDTCFKCGITLM